MTRRPLRLTLGGMPLELLPDGRVLVTLPPTALPFGIAMQATVIYPSLRALIFTATRLRQEAER